MKWLLLSLKWNRRYAQTNSPLETQFQQYPLLMNTRWKAESYTAKVVKQLAILYSYTNLLFTILIQSHERWVATRQSEHVYVGRFHGTHASRKPYSTKKGDTVYTLGEDTCGLRSSWVLLSGHSFVHGGLGTFHLFPNISVHVHQKEYEIHTHR